MFVVTTAIYEPHTVVGPVFSLTGLQRGIVRDITNLDAAFGEAARALMQQSRSLGGNGVIGAAFQVVDSSVQSIISGFGNTNQLYVFGTGTSVWLERLNVEEQRRLEDPIRNGSRVVQSGSYNDSYGISRALEVLEDGRVIAYAKSGPVEFRTMATFEGWKDR